MLLQKVCTFSTLAVQPDKKRILYRLGVKSGKMPEAQYIERLYKEIDEMLALCSVAGSYIVLPCTVTQDSVRVQSRTELMSQSAARLLRGSEYIVFMGSAVCRQAQNALEMLTDLGEMARAVILNAVMAQCADTGLDVLQGMIARQTGREGYRLTKRYSPGYGDIPLSFQQEIYQRVQMEALGVKITESYMLIPEKSVLAFAGVERIEK